MPNGSREGVFPRALLDSENSVSRALGVSENTVGHPPMRVPRPHGVSVRLARVDGLAKFSFLPDPAPGNVET